MLHLFAQSSNDGSIGGAIAGGVLALVGVAVSRKA